MKKILALLLLVLVLLGVSSIALAAPEVGDLLRFVPTEISVITDSVTVKGYFINLNEDLDIKNLTKVDMDVYKAGELLISGDFGDINQFTVKSLGAKYQSFTFNGEHDLNVGEYVCDESFYTKFSCSFTTVK